MLQRLTGGFVSFMAALLLAGCGGSQGNASSGAEGGERLERLHTSQLLARSAEINTEELAKARSPSAQTGTALPQVTKATARSPVYRFYNSQTGAHFYTIDVAERNRVQSTLPMFQYEGEAFFVSAVADTGLSPVYRFYNVQTGVHFYSISAEEKAHIEANLPQFHYEGVGYYASKTALQGMVPLYRFYVSTAGFHFYSASETEKDRIRANLPHYLFENVGYYVFGSVVQSFPVGGTLSGLAVGQSVVLQLNGGSGLTLSADGSFTFPGSVNRDATYAVSVATQPVGQTCAVTNGSGTVTAAVSSVSVTCSVLTYSIGGSVTGLDTGKTVMLQNNGGGNLLLPGNGAFTFAASSAHGSAFNVTVGTQPVGQTCVVGNGSGTTTGNVSNIAVTCATNTYAVGGSISGLGSSRSVVLQINGGGDLVRSANGSFGFAAMLTHGGTYLVSVKTQPVGQTCVVANGTGTLSGTVSNVSVTCSDNTHTVGGTLSGLAAGRDVVLQLNGASDLTRSADGAFTFASTVTYGGSYSVTVRTQPAGQTCSVSNGSGTAAGDIGNVSVSCSTNSYSVGGSISGLGSGKTVVLQNNATDDLTRTGNGSFVFGTAIPYSSTYAVSVRTQPVEQTCTVSNGLGTVGGAVSNVAVDCVDHVTIGGAVSGLIAGNPVVLTLNGGGDLTVSANGGFTFVSKTPLGETYVVGVRTQPRGQTCSASNATGTANAAVSNVGVTCVNNALTDLLISEVGGCPADNYSGCWLEVFNPTAAPINLSGYRLRFGATVVNLFDLPSATVAPGQYRLLAATDGHVPVTALNPVVVLNTTGPAPVWGGWSGDGLVELVSVGSGQTVDALRFGNPAVAPNPVTSSHWVGAPVTTTFSGAVSDQARALARPVAAMATQDTQSALDWVAVDYATPGGPNDVAPGATDGDNDGLPDSNEQAGSTYNGLDLYSMGARTGQRDIFIEVDHMSSAKAGVIPIQASLQMVKNAFALRGIAVHIDVGNLFAASFDPAQFNLGQDSSVVPYEPCLGFLPTECTGNSVNYRTVYQWKWQHFDPRRRAIFHYALFGDAPPTASWGRAELLGNDFVLTMGDISAASQWLTNEQAATFMHELGHNLGLRHGGNEDKNYKPNYLSVMNYLKDGVSPGNTFWPFREWQEAFGSVRCSQGSTHPQCSADPVPFVIDYSDGSSLPLNEAALYEGANVGRGALTGVYADWDEDGSLGATAVSRDLNGDGVVGFLGDYNDWAALTLPFARYTAGGLLQKSFQMSAARRAAKVPESGATVPKPLLGDRGPTVIVCDGGDARGARILQTLRAKSFARSKALRPR
ncbi:hypothetical protein [Hydrogenophaga sp. RWCD_12]|uniref:hypothetical protein n=1 Tax=Hydrogenophaga sp. RWCD_12 TaxID=3391190 RepID=UPI0039856203